MYCYILTRTCSVFQTIGKISNLSAKVPLKYSYWLLTHMTSTGNFSWNFTCPQCLSLPSFPRDSNQRCPKQKENWRSHMVECGGHYGLVWKRNFSSQKKYWLLRDIPDKWNKWTKTRQRYRETCKAGKKGWKGEVIFQKNLSERK